MQLFSQLTIQKIKSKNYIFFIIIIHFLKYTEKNNGIIIVTVIR